MKKNLWLFILICLSVAVIGYLTYSKYYSKPASANETIEISVFSIVEIDPIVQLRDGFKKRIQESDFGKTHKILFVDFNAQGDNSLVNQITDKIINQKSKPSLVYVLGTPIAQAIQKRDSSIIIVQGAVTDPIEAGLANSWKGSGKNYAATTDLPPIDKQINLILKLTPKVARLGLVYNPGEVNSVAVVARVRKFISENKINLTLVERPVSNSSEVSSAVQSLVGGADAIYLPPDNTAFSAINVISKLCMDNKLPLYTSATADVGILATLSLDYKTLGAESADIAISILDGSKKPGEIPIVPNSNPKIIINEKIAINLGIDLSVMKDQPNIEILNR